MKCRT